MSHEALPIDRARFSQALESLPIDALHSKAAELRNNMQHLKYSNEQMIPFADQGDQDCKDAMFENFVVIGRINERIDLLRAEVEKRGMRWADAEVEDRQNHLVNGATPETLSSTAPDTQSRTTTNQPTTQSGTLSDGQLRAQLDAITGQDDQDEGVHL